MMFRAAKIVASLLWLATLTVVGAAAQSGYQVVQLTQAGTISGTVKWSGPLPRIPAYPIDKYPQDCDPDSHKVRDLDRLIVGPQNGVANTVVFLKDISRGKAMDIPAPRRSLDQKQCRYEPHILLVPENGPVRLRPVRLRGRSASLPG